MTGVKSADDTLGRLLPATERGDKIGEANRTWAYVGGVVGYIVVFLLVWYFVRLLARILVILLFLAGGLMVCASVHENAGMTWQQLAGVVVMLGVAAGVTAVTVNIFTLTNRKDG